MPGVNALIEIDRGVCDHRNWQPKKFGVVLQAVMARELEPIYGLRFPGQPPLDIRQVDHQTTPVMIRIELPFSADVRTNQAMYENRLAADFCSLNGLQRHEAVVLISVAEEAPRRLPRRLAAARTD